MSASSDASKSKIHISGKCGFNQIWQVKGQVFMIKFYQLPLCNKIIIFIISCGYLILEEKERVFSFIESSSLTNSWKRDKNKTMHEVFCYIF